VYLARDLERAAALARDGVQAILTTEKDAVRLPAMEGPLPIWVLGVEIQVDPPEALSQIVSAAAEPSPNG
jgi:tetraacyldisaccharide-1-P 4'-kinase